MSKIVKLEVSNFKRIRAVEIEPTGAMVKIRGENEQGKSSLLDAITAALGSDKLSPPHPIRRGEKDAVIRVRLDNLDGFGAVTAERAYHRGDDGEIRSTLKLTTVEGVKVDKPQRRLDDLLSALSFDPLAFMRDKAEKQAETLRRLSGVDFKILDGRRQAAYEARTVANRLVDQLRARLAGQPPVDAPDAPVSAAALMEEQQTRSAAAAANDRKRQELARSREEYGRIEKAIGAGVAEVERIKASLAAAEASLAAARESLAKCLERGKALQAEVAALTDPDLEELPARVREVEAVNERVRQKQARAELAKELAAKEAEAKRLDGEIVEIDAQKQATLEKAALPVEGLSFDDAGATLDGLPLEQASQARKLRVSVAIGAALNPRLRAMLIRDGSCLDHKALALLQEEAEKADLQLWVEMVGSEGEGIVIEDGSVVRTVEAPTPAAARPA